MGHFCRTCAEGLENWLEIVLFECIQCFFFFFFLGGGGISWEQHQLKSSWNNWVVLMDAIFFYLQRSFHQ